MWTYNYVDELYHHGVKGMKWGVRKKRESATFKDYRSKKAAYKQAKRDYNKSFNKAYNKASAAYSPFKKHRQANDERWNDVYDKAKAADKAQKAYKQAKKVRKDAINSTTEQIRKDSNLAEKLFYNDATRKKAAKYVVDNDMSISEAKRKANSDAMRNTALFLAAYGTATFVMNKKL